MTCETTAIDTLLSTYFAPGTQWSVTTGNSGANNTTLYVEADGAKYILRIYETHKDERKVLFEHEVLQQLAKSGRLPFQVPVPVPSKDGRTVQRLPDETGKVAGLTRYIPGETPDLERPETVHSFGQYAGALLDALSRVQVQQPVLYRPYYEIEHTHPLCPLSRVVAWCEEAPKPFASLAEELRWIGERISAFRAFVPKVSALPHQFIHGDLNASNALSGADHRISTILDFEFVTRDVRVMEAAVCISDFMVQEANESAFWEKTKLFMDGFSSMITLSVAEAEALPTLVLLRRLDVFIHFLGRYLDGVDEAGMLKQQIKDAASVAGLQQRLEQRFSAMCK